MTERCNDDVAFLWWKYDYDEDDDYDKDDDDDYYGDDDNNYFDRDHKDDKKKNIVHPYFQQDFKMVVVVSFSCSVRLIFILPNTKPTLWYYRK